MTNESAGKPGGPLVRELNAEQLGRQVVVISLMMMMMRKRSGWRGRVGGVDAVYLPPLWLHMELGKCIRCGRDSISSANGGANHSCSWLGAGLQPETPRVASWPNERVFEAVGRRCGSPVKTWKEFSRPGN